MYIASKFISIFLTIFVYYLISKIAFHLLIKCFHSAYSAYRAEQKKRLS